MNNLIDLIHGYNIYHNFNHNKYVYRPIGWNVNGNLFYRLIKETNPEIILELGSWYGASSISMGQIIKKDNLNTKIICVDSWLGSEDFIGLHDRDDERQLLSTFGYPNAYYQFLANVCFSNLQDIIIPFPQSIHNAIRWLNRQEIKAELIYVDGSNNALDMYQDIVYSWSILKDNGIIFGDDYNNVHWPSIDIGINKFCDDFNIKPIFLPEFPNHWIIKKTNNITCKSYL